MSEPFTFSSDNLAKIQEILTHYPSDRQASAILPLLDLAQRQNNGWLSQSALEIVAALLKMPIIRVYEVASFYTMFNLKPVGKYHLQVCRTTPCWLKGSDTVLKKCKEIAGITAGETSADGLFSLIEVECLGACVNAPVVQINDDYLEDMTAETIENVLNALQKGESLPEVLLKNKEEKPHA